MINRPANEIGKVDAGRTFRIPGRFFRDAVESDADSATKISVVKALALDTSSEATAILRRALSDPAPAVRVEAIKGLASRKEPDSEGQFLLLLKDHEPTVRAAAAGAIKNVGIKSAEELIVLLQDPEPTVRREVLNSLLVSGSPESREAAWQSLPRESVEVQAYVLERVGGASVPLSYLSAAVLSAHAVLSINAIQIAAGSSLPEAEKILIDALASRVASVRRAAVSALASRSSLASTKALIEAWLRPERDAEIAVAIINGLGQRQDAVIDRILAQASTQRDVEIASAAIAMLCARKEMTPVGELLEAFRIWSEAIPEATWRRDGLLVMDMYVTNEGSPIDKIRTHWRVRNQEPAFVCMGQLVKALAVCREEGVLDRLLRNLSSGTQRCRCAAALALAGHDCSSAVSGLGKALIVGPESVSCCAAWALGHFQSEESLVVLIKGIWPASTNPDVPLQQLGSAAKREVLSAIGRRPLEQVMPLLDQAYRDTSPAGRCHIVETMEQTVHPSSNGFPSPRLLFQAIKDANPTVRKAGVNALAGYSTKEALRALHSALDDVNSQVAQESADALIHQGNPSCNRMLRRWVWRATQHGWDSLRSSQIAVIRQYLMSSVAEMDLSDAQQLLALLEKADTGPELYKAHAAIQDAYKADFFGDTQLEGSANFAKIRKRLFVLPIVLSVGRLLPRFSMKDLFGDMFQGASEEQVEAHLTHLLQGYGRSLRPVLRHLLRYEDVPEPVRCGLCMTLGKANDKESAGKFVELLESPSAQVRSSAMRALIELGDGAASELTPALSNRNSNAQIIAQYLTQILDGHRPPALPDLIMHSLVHDEMNALVDRSNTAVGDRRAEFAEMTLLNHLRELQLRLFLVFAVTAIGGIIAGGWIGASTPAFLAKLYGVTVSTFQTYIRPGIAYKQYIGTLAATWVGWPFLSYQIWRFMAPGLYRRERMLALRPVVTITGLFLGVPVLLFCTSHALLSLPLHLSDSVILIQTTDRVTLTSIAAIAWLFGFQKIWRWLRLAISTDFVTIMSGGSGERLIGFVRVLLSLAAVATLLATSIFPAYALLCLMLAVIIGLTLLAAFIWMLVTMLAQSIAFDNYVQIIVDALIPNRYVLAAVSLSLAIWPKQMAWALQECGLAPLARIVWLAKLSPDTVSILRLSILAMWSALLLSFVSVVIGVLLKWRNKQLKFWPAVLVLISTPLILLVPGVLILRSALVSLAFLCGSCALILVLVSRLTNLGLGRLLVSTRASLPLSFVTGVCCLAPVQTIGGIAIWAIVSSVSTVSLTLAAKVLPSRIFPRILRSGWSKFMLEFRRAGREFQEQMKEEIRGKSHF